MQANAFLTMAAAPEMFLAIAGMVLLMIGAFQASSSSRLVTSLTLICMAAALFVLVANGKQPREAFGGLFVADGFAYFMKILILLGSGGALIISQRFIEREGMNRFEYPVLFLFATLGMMLMVSANDLISLYVGLELQSLSLYVIAAFQRDSLRSAESGLKYFVLGALSSGLLLYGASMVYGFAGTTRFEGIADALSAGPAPIGLIVGMVFICAALAFKVSAVPFHMWTPDVYEGAPTSVTAFFAVAAKIAAMALFMRVLIGPFGHLVGEWQQVIVVISILSMVLGGFAAISQRNIKRLMAYSSIGHVGFALVGLAAGTQDGVRGVALYMTIYLFMNIGTFACILCMRVNDRMVEGIDDLAGLSRTQPLMALALAIFMFSMAGIPPLAGFFGKLYVFLAAVDAGLYTLAVIGVLASVVSAFYYLRIIKLMYFDEPVDAFDKPISTGVKAVLTISGLFTAFFIVFAEPITRSAGEAAAALFAGG